MSLFCIQCLFSVFNFRFFVFNLSFLYSMSLFCMQCRFAVFSVFAGLSCELMVLISNLCRCRCDRSLFYIQCLFSVFNVSCSYSMSLFCIQCRFSVCNVTCLYAMFLFCLQCVRRFVLSANGFD